MVGAIYALAGCAVVAGGLVGGTLVWQEAAGVDTVPATTVPSEPPTGPSETTGTILVPGPPGPRGERGYQGFRGWEGRAGLPGPAGPPGSTSAGQQGEPGQPGQPGRDGVDGEDGAPGRPPTAAELDDAVARALATTIPSTPPGPTDEQVLQAVTAYCAVHGDCVGPPGAPGAPSQVPGPPGVAGADGRDGVDGINGTPGPAGPPGPPSSELICPAGFEPDELTLNAPGGQVTMYVCLQGVAD